MTYDHINPSHYRAANGWEAIDVLEAFVPGNPYRFAAGKYILRAGKKPGQDMVQDLRKAIWWLEREIKSLEPAPLNPRIEEHQTWMETESKFAHACPDLDQEYEPGHGFKGVDCIPGPGCRHEFDVV